MLLMCSQISIFFYAARTWQRSQLQPATILHGTEPDVRLAIHTRRVPQPMYMIDFLVPHVSGDDQWQLLIKRIRNNNLDQPELTIRLSNDIDLGDSAPGAHPAGAVRNVSESST